MTTGDETLGKIIQDLARTDPTWNRFLKRQPNYRYFTVKGSLDQPFWTVEPLNHKGHNRYASGIYKYIKTKKAYRLTNENYHVRRKDAKARALELYYHLTKEEKE